MFSDVCNRCQERGYATIMSRYNLELICAKCANKERSHVAYKLAADIELKAYMNGNPNFEGVGRPIDLI